MRARLALLLALLAAGCGGDEPVQSSTPTPNPTSEPAPQGSAANAFIGSLAVDPGDGTLMIGTGLGLFRLRSGAAEPERVTGELSTPDGQGTLSSNLVVRYAEPGALLASGHPEGGALPEYLGLISSADAGDTWEVVSELGKSDFHILQATGDHVVAARAEETDVLVSGDGGRTFEKRTPPAMPLDVAFDPKDPQRMVVATEQGSFSSDDGGDSWRPRDPVRSDHLAWGAEGLYRSDPGGLVKASADGGATWKDRGNIGLTVNELAIDEEGALYAAIPGGEVKKSTDGGATWERLLRLQ